MMLNESFESDDSNKTIYSSDDSEAPLASDGTDIATMSRDNILKMSIGELIQSIGRDKIFKENVLDFLTRSQAQGLFNAIGAHPQFFSSREGLIPILFQHEANMVFLEPLLRGEPDEFRRLWMLTQTPHPKYSHYNLFHGIARSANALTLLPELIEFIPQNKREQTYHDKLLHQIGFFSIYPDPFDELKHARPQVHAYLASRLLSEPQRLQLSGS